MAGPLLTKRKIEKIKKCICKDCKYCYNKNCAGCEDPTIKRIDCVKCYPHSAMPLQLNYG